MLDFEILDNSEFWTLEMHANVALGLLGLSCFAQHRFINEYVDVMFRKTYVGLSIRT